MITTQQARKAIEFIERLARDGHENRDEIEFAQEAQEHVAAVNELGNLAVREAELRDAILQLICTGFRVSKKNLSEPMQHAAKIARIYRCMNCGQFRFLEDMETLLVGTKCTDNCALDPELLRS